MICRQPLNSQNQLVVFFYYYYRQKAITISLKHLQFIVDFHTKYIINDYLFTQLSIAAFT